MGKLLLIADLIQRGYGQWLFQRMLPGIFLVAWLVITLSILASTLLIFGVYSAYFALLSGGLTAQMAMFCSISIAILILLALSLAIFAYLRQFRILPQSATQKSPVSSSAMDLLHTFVNGLLADPKQK